MKNQFFYTVQQGKQIFTCSFNPDYVIRAVEFQPKCLLLALDDFHEDVTPRNVMEGKKAVVKNVKGVVYSEIMLNEEDTKRYKEVCGISFPDPSAYNVDYTESNIGFVTAEMPEVPVNEEPIVSTE